MRIQLVTETPSENKPTYLVLPIFEAEKASVRSNLVNLFLEDNPKFGKLYETQLLFGQPTRFILVGAGKKDKFNFEKLQNWAGTATKYLLTKTSEAIFLLPKTNLSAQKVAEAVSLGIEIAAFDPIKQLKSDKAQDKLNTVKLVIDKADRSFQEGVKKGQIIAEGINLARNLGDLPANLMTPTYFLNTAKKIAKDNRLKITVLTEKQAKAKGMEAFVGVAQGSDEPSYMIAIEYKGEPRSKEKWALVGKGITYDSGGLSLKPSEAMDDMKYDMLGAAAVLGAIQAIAKLGIKTNLVSIMAVTENLPSGKSQRPGDIVKMYSGKTAEIKNTDAEGRLVLVDAISYAQKDFKANRVIDLATLTGAMIVALGDFITGAFGNNPKFTQELISKGVEVGERFWEMPMDEEFNDYIKSDFADIINTGTKPRTAGSIMGAKFIETSVNKETQWIHLDIAGTAWDLKPTPFRGPGASGVGIKTLVELIAS